MLDHLTNAYRRLILGHPVVVLVLLSAVLGFFASHASDFKLDASADSLLLEDDSDLQKFREVTARYPGQELLIVTFTPRADLFSDAALAELKALREQLRSVGMVESILTILDAPLVKSSDTSLTAMADDVPTLEHPDIDRARAKIELLDSPVYSKSLVSADAHTTSLLLTLRDNLPLRELSSTRNALLVKRNQQELSAPEAVALRNISARYEIETSAHNARVHADIATVRAILDEYRQTATVHLGGVSMIADDMVTFVRNDLVVFGAGVLVFLVLVLGVIFRRVRWVVLPLLSCFYAGLLMMGLLGLVGWKVTVISSNFLSLMLIITISMNIHLAVRFRQLRAEAPHDTHVDIVARTLGKMVWPCLYTALTTIIGFSSLVFSDIKPVIDFGWMMSIGLGVVFLTSFSVFPCALVLMGAPASAGVQTDKLRFTALLATFTERYGNVVLVVALALGAISAVGISRLTVENSFINYFSKDTEIYQGMLLIDEQLGGTTPLEVLLDLNEARIFEEEADPETSKNPAYWFTPFKIERIKEIHDYLDSLPEVGKVLSLASVIRVAEGLNDGREFDSLQLSLLYKRVPESLRRSLIDPYVSVANNEARISLRMIDSLPELRRQEFLQRLDQELRAKFELTDADFAVTGLMVMYNNMLQSLYKSQISTIGAVLAGIGVMFLVLFRSLSLAVIGIIPNVLAAAIVLGMMGLAGIPLDMMTITIAAITMGIAVDNSIHYIYRFREEYAHSGDYLQTLHICHASIGKAVFFTSITVIFGFSILVLSNFIPTIIFGLLTGLAMLIALLAALTLLPKLILLVKPF